VERVFRYCRLNMRRTGASAGICVRFAAWQENQIRSGLRISAGIPGYSSEVPRRLKANPAKNRSPGVLDKQSLPSLAQSESLRAEQIRSALGSCFPSLEGSHGLAEIYACLGSRPDISCASQIFELCCKCRNQQNDRDRQEGETRKALRKWCRRPVRMLKEMEESRRNRNRFALRIIAGIVR
jgi:hypothetical protein